MKQETLTAALDNACIRWANRTALVSGRQRISYAELGEAMSSLARSYRRLGINRGDRVICSLSNRPEFAIAFGATWSSAAVHVGVDQQLTTRELSRLVHLTDAAALVYEPSQGSSGVERALRRLSEAHPHICLLVGDSPPSGHACYAFADLARHETEGTETCLGDGPSPADPAVIFVTSGTTGTPKTALGYHGNLAHRWHWLAEELRFGPDDVHLAHMPLAHGFGLMMSMAALTTGGRLVLLDQFSAERALEVMEREQVTVLHGSPTHFKLILSRLNGHRGAIEHLRIGVGTAACFAPALVRSIFDDLGMDFMLMYGSSEGVGVVTRDRTDILRGSVGRPPPGAVAIVGANRRSLPTGEVGEIAFSREVYPIRYWGPMDSAATGGDNGRWYYSGDLGRLDEDGRLYVLGKVKHQINRGGLHIDPIEVEAALLRCPGVADAAVIGQPDPILGEVVCACIVSPTGEQMTLAQLRAALGDDLAPYKLPDELCILERIPTTRVGKVDLTLLRASVALAAPERLVHR